MSTYTPPPTYIHLRGEAALADMQVPLGEVNPPRHTITQILHEQGDVVEMLYRLVIEQGDRIRVLEERLDRFTGKLMELELLTPEL